MIKSAIDRGFIYAGDTPLACSIVVEQTGPMQLTAWAGSFTTTGQARVRTYDPTHHDALLVAGAAEMLPDGKRVRVWINGQKAQTYTLAADRMIDLTSDPLAPVAYDVDLISDGMQTAVLLRRKVVGVEEYGVPPPGWQKVHELLFEFTLPPACADLTSIPVYVVTVLSGFPPGTGPADWSQQAGSG